MIPEATDDGSMVVTALAKAASEVAVNRIAGRCAGDRRAGA